jgi:hypothetical protein
VDLSDEEAKAAGLGVAEAVDAGALGLDSPASSGWSAELLAGDFAAGLHLESSVEAPSAPAEGEADAAPPGRAEARTVPAKYLDWSASFSGRLSDFGVVDLVQILDVSQKSGVLVLRFPEALGQVKLSDGEIMSAELISASGETVRGEEAVYRMVGQTEGTFRFEQGAVERRKLVKTNNATILMEACRLQDEKGLSGAGPG